MVLGVALSLSLLSLQSPTKFLWLEDVPQALYGQEWGKVRIGKSMDGDPISIGGKTYEHGIGSHAKSCWILPMDGKGLRFTASVGMCDGGHGAGSVRFWVYVDNRKVFESPVMRPNEKAILVDVSLKGAEELKLVVDDAGDGITADHANWADAKIEVASGFEFPASFRPVDMIEPYKWDGKRVPVTGSGPAQLSEVDVAVVSAMREHGLVGCGVAIVKGERVVYSKGFGYAELPDRPFLPTSMARCASVSKLITGVCALKLMDQGKLSLNEPILPILERIGVTPRPVNARKPDSRLSQVLVRHLMDHTSGLSGATYTASLPGIHLAKEFKLAGPATAKDVCQFALGNTQLSSEPGTRHEYSNVNFVLLARVIESKTGMLFSEYLNRVCMPMLGISAGEIAVSKDQFGPRDPRRNASEVAYYQTMTGKSLSTDPYELLLGPVFGEAYRGYSPESSDGGGGICASATGLAKLLVALHRGGLSKTALQEVTTPPSYLPKTANHFYSKGMDVLVTPQQIWIAHGGMTAHSAGVVGYSSGYQFVIVANSNSERAPYADSFLSAAIGKALSVAPPLAPTAN